MVYLRSSKWLKDCKWTWYHCLNNKILGRPRGWIWIRCSLDAFGMGINVCIRPQFGCHNNVSSTFLHLYPSLWDVWLVGSRHCGSSMSNNLHFPEVLFCYSETLFRAEKERQRESDFVIPFPKGVYSNGKPAFLLKSEWQSWFSDLESD